jgi:hypothetical protein
VLGKIEFAPFLYDGLAAQGAALYGRKTCGTLDDAMEVGNNFDLASLSPMESMS